MIFYNFYCYLLQLQSVQKEMVIFSHLLQYTGYSPKLSTRALSHPIKIILKTDFSLSRMGELTAYHL